MQMIAFGGGCHWCTEAVFQQVKGVISVHQGFVRSLPPDDTWSEAADLYFDPEIIGLGDLLAVHLATHASTANHQMRGKYRSAVYTTTAEQNAEIEGALDQAKADTGLDFVTRVLPHMGFKPSDERFHDYYSTDPERPFCRTYIDPKLAKLRVHFADLIRADSSSNF